MGTFEDYGFGAKFTFDALGVNKLTALSPIINGLAGNIDKAQKGINGLGASLGAIGIGAVGLGLTGGIISGFDKVYEKAVDLESIVTILRGKLQDMSQTKFDKLIQDIRQVGIQTEYTDYQVVEAADLLRAFGASEDTLLQMTKTSLGVASVFEEEPRKVAAVMQEMAKSFELPIDAMMGYADAIVNARNTTKLMSQPELGIGEMSNYFKNIARFSSSLKINPEEMMAYTLAAREVGMSSQLAGRVIGQVGLGLSSIEFRKQDELKKLGVLMRNPMTQERLPFNEIFKQLYSGYERTIESSGKIEADRLMEEIFNQSQMGAFNLLSSAMRKLGGVEGWDNLIITLSPELNEGAMQNQWNRLLSTVKKMRKVISGAMESGMTSLGLPLVELSKGPIQVILTTVSKIAEFLGDPKNKTIVDALVGIASVLTIALGAASAITLISGFIGLFKAVLPIITSGFGVLSAGISAFLPILGALVIAGVLIYLNWDKISGVLKNVWEWVKKNKDEFTWFGKKLWTVVLPVATYLWFSFKQIVDYLNKLADAINFNSETFSNLSGNFETAEGRGNALARVIGGVLTLAFIRMGVQATIATGKAILGMGLMILKASIATIRIGVYLVVALVKFAFQAGIAAARAIVTGISFLSMGTSATGASVSVATLTTNLGALAITAGLIVALIGAVVFVFTLLSKQQEYFRKGTTGSLFWDSMMKVIQGIAHYLSPIAEWIDWIIQAVKTGVGYVITAWTYVIGFFNNLWTSISEIFTNIGTAIKDAFWNAISWVEDKFLGFLNWFIDRYNTVAQSLGLSSLDRFERMTSPDIETGAGNKVDQSGLNETLGAGVGAFTKHEHNFKIDMKVDGDMSEEKLARVKREIHDEVARASRLAYESGMAGDYR